MTRVNFIMMIGIPGSGKSTIAETIQKNMIDCKLFSSDAIRKEIYGDESIQTDPKKVFMIMRDRTEKALINGYNVIYDATNIKKKDRKQVLDMIKNMKEAEYDICTTARFMNIDLNICLAQNKLRNRIVPEEVIIKMYNKLEAPSLDEGFDEIITTRR